VSERERIALIDRLRALPTEPEWLTEQQKLRRVNNLLMELRRTGKVENRGSRGKPEWVLGRLNRSGDQGLSSQEDGFKDAPV